MSRLCVFAFDGCSHCFQPLKARSFLPDGFSCQQVLHLQQKQRQNRPVLSSNSCSGAKAAAKETHPHDVTPQESPSKAEESLRNLQDHLVKPRPALERTPDDLRGEAPPLIGSDSRVDLNPQTCCGFIPWFPVRPIRNWSLLEHSRDESTVGVSRCQEQTKPFCEEKN